MFRLASLPDSGEGYESLTTRETQPGRRKRETTIKRRRERKKKQKQKRQKEI